MSILCPDSIDTTLKELHERELDRGTLKPEKLLEAMLVKQRIDRVFRDNPHDFSTGDGWSGDLVVVGVRTVLGLLGLLGLLVG